MIRRIWQYSLRSLLVATVVVAVVLGMLTKRYRGHKAAVTAILDHGGTFAVKYDVPEWVRTRLADQEYFYNCTRVSLGPGNRGYDPTKPIGNDELRVLIPHMNAFSNFRQLRLDRSDISDAGLESLSELRFIDHLSLGSTKITDAGLLHLAELPTLARLQVEGTLVTPDGISQFMKSCPNCLVEADFPIKPPDEP